MKSLRVVLIALFAGVAVWFAGNGVADAYEFHMLNGTVVQGDLTSFSKGVFTVDTLYGTMDLDTDKIDYIVVQKTDPGPAAFKACPPVPGIKVLPRPREGKVMPEAVPDGDGTEPAPPTPLSSMSITPAPMRSWSVTGAEYPGRFKGAGK